MRLLKVYLSTEGLLSANFRIVPLELVWPPILARSCDPRSGFPDPSALLSQAPQPGQAVLGEPLPCRQAGVLRPAPEALGPEEFGLVFPGKRCGLWCHMLGTPLESLG